MKTLQITDNIRKQLSLKTLHFSFNWNNKLDCKSFSTIRLKNDKKYELLDLYEVTVKRRANKQNVSIGIARLQVINNFLLHTVTPGMSFLDANLSVIDFVQLVKTMYKNKNVDFRKDQMSFLVFQYLDSAEVLSFINNLK